MGSRNPYLKLIRPFTVIAALLGGIFLYIAFSHNFIPNFDMLYLALIFMFLQGGGQAYNQCVEDEIEIDRINGKFDRPVVSGEIPAREARLIGSFLIILAVVLSLSYHDLILTLLVSFGAFLAWQYTDYPIRAKRFFLINNAWQACARGFLPIVISSYFVNHVFIYSHIILATVLFLWVFGLQTTKDMNDIVGDERYKIKTVPVVLGERNALIFMMTFVIFTFLFLYFTILYHILGYGYCFAFILIVPSILAILKTKSEASENNIGWKIFYITLGLWFIFIMLIENGLFMEVI